MPLNYSKWDQLELSDDSDIEGHPNVDKRSLIRWKQRDIHEKREVRKHRIATLHAEIACNDILYPRIQETAKSLESDGIPKFMATIDQLRTNPSPDLPPTGAPGQPTYDAMLLSLYLQVVEDVKKTGIDPGSNNQAAAAVKAALDSHLVKLTENQAKYKKELETEEKEQKKHITSDDIHEGFESKYVPPPPPPPPVKGSNSKKTTKTTEFEVLNPTSSSSSTPPPPQISESANDEGDELPELTPGLLAFSRLPIHEYERSWKLIQQHRDIVVPGAYDALLVAAFRAQHDGDAKYAKQCIHQGLLLQYSDKLGRDGLRVFFKKMIDGDKRAEGVFLQDVEQTYAHLVTRVNVSLEEEAREAAAGGSEQIQLVPENPSQTIGFNVPDGPPPEDLRLEGPGTEDLDVEEVRKALQLRWDVFKGFNDDMKAALRNGSLDRVNKVLGSMDVGKAEEVVGLLDMAGILSFAEGGIRDETGKGKAREEDEREEDEREEDEGEETAEVD